MNRTMLAILLTAACGGAEASPPAATPTPTPPPADKAPPAEAPPEAAAPMYACPMHPDVTSATAGDCSKCGMALVQPEGHDHAGHDHDKKPVKDDDGHH